MSKTARFWVLMHINVRTFGPGYSCAMARVDDLLELAAYYRRRAKQSANPVLRMQFAAMADDYLKEADEIESEPHVQAVYPRSVWLRN